VTSNGKAIKNVSVSQKATRAHTHTVTVCMKRQWRGDEGAKSEA